MTGLPRRPAGIIAALLFAVVGSGCGSPSAPTGEGLVVGGIIPCAALGPPIGEHYAAGTVTVLQGQVTWRATGPGASAAVFPTAVAARATVETNTSYQFSLAPGKYVLEAHFPPPANVNPFIDFTVRPGDIEQVDIPNMCI